LFERVHLDAVVALEHLVAACRRRRTLVAATGAGDGNAKTEEFEQGDDDDDCDPGHAGILCVPARMAGWFRRTPCESCCPLSDCSFYMRRREPRLPTHWASSSIAPRLKR